jgi:hypothetical protein
MGAKGAPATDELLFCFIKFHGSKLRQEFRIFEIY